MIENNKTTTDDAIVFETEIQAPPLTVFEALTNETRLREWWYEGGTASWDIEARVGGKWRSRGRDETCGDWVTEGEVLQIERPVLLEYTWRETVEYRDGAVETIVRYDLQPTGNGGTLLKLTHSGFGGNSAARESYTNGWPGVFELITPYTERDSGVASLEKAVVQSRA